MKKTLFNRIVALGMVFCLALVFTACGDKKDKTPASESQTADKTVYATDGGNITLPEGFAAATEANKIATQLTGDTLAGNLNIASYRTTGYFSSNGSITLNFKGDLVNSAGESVKVRDAEHANINVALWKEGESKTEYLTTVVFQADGANKTYTFSNLEPGAQYRLAFTTAVAKYRVNATFNIVGITAEGDKDKETAAAA